MSSISPRPDDVIIGVDTHKREHVAVALSGLGAVIEGCSVPANNVGYGKLLSWAQSLGRVHAFGVEGTGGYGIGLARFLRRHRVRVIEVSRPPRAGERRNCGKSDRLDAENAARQVLAGRATTTPKMHDGAVEAIRLTRVARRTAVRAHSQAMMALKATLVGASDELRAKLEPLSDYKLILACSQLTAVGELEDPDIAMRHTLRSLAERWMQLHEEIKIHSKRLAQLTEAVAPELVAAFGIGPDIAGELLVTAGGNDNRIRSEAAFAKLCGACPIPTGSGQTNGRHRLNRGGNRQANAALYRVVVVRMRWHEPTIAYVRRRTAEGLSKKEIIRCLKRYVAREVYHLLPATAAAARGRRAA